MRLLVILICILVTACGPGKRAVKTETHFQYRDSSRVNYVSVGLKDNVKIIKDDSRIRVVYYLPFWDSSGEQLKDREEIYENNIITRDSTAIKIDTKADISAGSQAAGDKNEEIKEQRGPNILQSFFIFTGVMALIYIVMYFLNKKFKIFRIV